MRCLIVIFTLTLSCCVGYALQSARSTPPDPVLRTYSPAPGPQAENSLRLILPGQHSQALTPADLSEMPHKTATIHNPHTKADETYSGIPLSDLLAAHGVPLGEKLRGKALSDYIIATGADGYKAVLSLAEVDTSFHPGEVLIADSMDGKPLDEKTGPFRLVVTEDKRPARCVHSLVSIELRAAE